MKNFFLPAQTLQSYFLNIAFLKNWFFLLIMIIAGVNSSSQAQQLTINPGGNMVLNGNVSLVLNNAALQNNGTFTAGNSTVNFSGQNDTLVSYVAGKSLTTFNNLSVTKSTSGIALKSAVAVKNVLAVKAGNLYTYDNLTLRSDANLTARVDMVAAGSNIYGKANVERYIPARRAWRLMTAPVTNSNTIFNSWQNKGVFIAGQGLLVTGTNPTGAEGNGLDISSQNSVSMKGFNYSTQGFVSILNTKVAVSPGTNGSADNKGYFVFVRGDRNPVNTSISNVNVTTLTSTGTLQTGAQNFTASPLKGKYTLVGNPYASPVNFDSVTRTNLIKRFYVWDPALNIVGGYVMLDDLDNDGVYATSVLGSSQTKYIQSGQAFFVQTVANANAFITFNETSKSGTITKSMFRPVTNTTTNGNGAGQIITTLNLLNSDSTTTVADGTMVQFNNIFSSDVDLDDAAKFSNTNENISILRNNVSLAAERRPAAGFSDTVYFRLATTTQRSYQFVFEASGLEQPGMSGFLEDSYLASSTLISLSGTTVVNFSINSDAASAAINRFKIVFKPADIVLPVTISNVKAYQSNNNIAVEWKVENEINMVKYEVEKSTDGAVFTRVNTTNVTGNNNAYNTYSWIDVNSVNGNNFYRIKSYDRSGEINYSSIVKVTVVKTAVAGSFSIYPNPVTGNVINLLMKGQAAGQYRVKLTSTIGQLIFEKNIQSNGGNSTASLNPGTKLLAGIYQLEITGQDNTRNTQKVIVE